MPPRPPLTPEIVTAISEAVPRRAVVIWVYLYARAGYDTSKAWPSTTTIGKAVGTNRHHVSTEIAALEEAGWLKVEPRKGTSNRYTVITPPGVTATVPTARKGVTAVVSGGGIRTVPHLVPPRDTDLSKNSNKNVAKEEPPKSRTLEALIARWNALPNVGHCRKATEARHEAFNARMKDDGWADDVQAALDRVRTSRACQGEGDRGWIADIDWFLRADTVTRLLEGKLDFLNDTNKSQPKGKPHVFSATD